MVEREKLCVLLLLDGLDEAYTQKRKILAWIDAFFEPHVYIIMTTRPAAIEDAREELGKLGFEAKQILPLTREKGDELAGKIMARSGVGAQANYILMTELHRREYAALTRTPITLNLLVQVLARVEWGSATMTIAEVYGHAVSLVLQVDTLKVRYAGCRVALATAESDVQGTLRAIAFANHVQGKRSQPWSAFNASKIAGHANKIAEIQQEAEHGGLPLLEVVGGRVQFVHLSYQEYLAAEAVALLWHSRQCEDGDHLAPGVSYQEYLSAETLARVLERGMRDLGLWLVGCAGEPWWSDVLLMVAELLAPATDLLFALAQDPRGRLLPGGVANLNYGKSLLRVGQKREVLVDRFAGNNAIVFPRGARWPMTVPRAVVQLPAAGVGVLLLAAARAGATPVVVGLIGHGVHIGVVDGDQNTAAHLACEHGHEACACELVKLGALAHPFAKNARFVSPALAAAGQKLCGVYRRFAPNPADREEARGHLAREALVAAARCGALPEVERLLGTEELESATPEGCTALSAAAENGHADVIAVLAEARANVDQLSGTTPDAVGGSTMNPALMFAARGGHVEAVRALLAAQADPNRGNSHGHVPLCFAAQIGAVEVVCDLLAAHARVDQPSTRKTTAGGPPGWTAIMSAAVSGHADVCEVVLAARANPNAHTNFPGFTPLVIACMCRTGGGVVRILAAARADLEKRARFPLRATPLQCSAFLNSPEVCEALLEVRADASARCRTIVGSGTALDIATKWDRRAAMAVLAARTAGP